MLITVPLRALLDQFAPDFPDFCKVGTGHNKDIDFEAKGFIAVTDSVHLLKELKFEAIFVDEAHHPLPPELPLSRELFRVSATHKDEPDFRYTMGQAIEDGVLCDYDITVPALTAHHQYVCLAGLLLKQAGRFRRVLAYCNSIAEAKRFRMVLKEFGLAAWHINGNTPFQKRETAMEDFAGPLQRPVHVLVTVEVLGEGINIPNADTCMFVEPRNSYRSIIQAIGRVLRHHAAKTLAHIVLPAMAISGSGSMHEVNSTRTSQSLEEQNAEENTKHASPRMKPSTPTLWDRQLQETRDTIQLQKEELREARLDREDEFQFQEPERHGTAKGMPALKSLAVSGPIAVNAAREVNGAAQIDSQQNGKGGHQRSVEPLKLQTRRKSGTRSSHAKEHVVSNVQVEANNRLTAMARNMTSFKAKNDKYLRRLKLKTSGGRTALDQQYSSQLERFLSVLMLADPRLAGGVAGHRITIADCTIGDALSPSMEDGIYTQVSLILSQRGPWEARLAEVEAFTSKHGRLPRISVDDSRERSLGVWLQTQRVDLKQQRLSMHRLRKLQSSAHLITRRVKQWQEDLHGRFRTKCQRLREYVRLHQMLPRRGARVPPCDRELGVWLGNLKQRIRVLSPNEKQMLSDVDPLVEAAVQKWLDCPPARDLARWEQCYHELSSFLSAKGRLPSWAGLGKQIKHKQETKLNNWLYLQRRDYLAGFLPDELAERLRTLHPQVVAYFSCSDLRHQRTPSFL